MAVAASASYAVLAVVLYRLGSPQGAVEFFVFFLFLVALWLTGAGVRRWRREEGERRRLATEVATAAERARIARELHDIVTHHVTAMVVQAEATQYLLVDAPGKAADGLDAISGTGRRALTELRSLLDVLEATGDDAREPTSPTLGRVMDLIDQARQAGQPVELVEAGDGGAAPVDAELAAYRVVQEALTNALRFANGRTTLVSIRRGGGTLEVEVTTDSSAIAVSDPMSGGRGLSGLRERVQLLGGELTAGTGPTGHFTVRAHLPETEHR